MHAILPRRFGLLVLALALGCARNDAAPSPASASAPLAISFPAETQLRLGDPQLQLALALMHQAPPFTVEWHAMSGGPKTIEAFRAHALDASVVGDTPPVHAVFTGLDVKIIGVQLRNTAAMSLATAPGCAARSVQELRGKRIAYSPGQAQGALVLRALKHAGVASREVTLVELESDAFRDALSNQQVDAAPLGGPSLARYLREYPTARAIAHGVRDNVAFLYAPSELLADASKAAALRAYVELRARAMTWAHEHPEPWLQAYYHDDQGLSREEGQAVLASLGPPEFPSDWSHVIALTQETIDLLAAQHERPSFPAERLFDRRFERVAAEISASVMRATPESEERLP